jgi:O-antigen ligase
MWAQASTAWFGSSIWQVVFGLGPDSFRTLQLSPGYVHPHNSMIQAAMEFGLIGLCFLLYLAWQVLRCASRALKGDNNLVPWIIASGLLSMGCYSLLDGIIYHGGPFLVCVLMGAYLFVFSDSYQSGQRSME